MAENHMVDRSAGMLADQPLALPSTDRARLEEDRADGLCRHNDFDFETSAGFGPIEELRPFRE